MSTYVFARRDMRFGMITSGYHRNGAMCRGLGLVRAVAFSSALSIALGAAIVSAEVIGKQSSRDSAEVYHLYCSVCHGEQGDGRSRAQGSFIPPPRDFTTPAAAADLTRDRMIRSVRDGRPGTAMVGWTTQLSDREIEELVDYIRNHMMMPVATLDAGRGRRLYANTCSVCHGDDGRGARWTAKNLNPPPRNFSRPNTRAELSREQMIHVATHGKPDTAMPGFDSQLSDEDIAEVVDYIRTAFVPPLPLVTAGSPDPGTDVAGRVELDETGKVNMSLPLPRGLNGDPNRGLALYLANCSACHGFEGDGRGPRAYFILPKPRNFQHPGSRETYNRPALYKAIARGSLGAEMPAWDTVFDDQQIADVAEYVFRAFIRPEAVSAKLENANRL